MSALGRISGLQMGWASWGAGLADARDVEVWRSQFLKGFAILHAKRTTYEFV